ncbi:MAG: hypothetical protein GF365_01605 [Candidatus Buchananbacteria bacterium]|nr:hypothetical protein [Candidatus Buchananbacteria bacterium]
MPFLVLAVNDVTFNGTVDFQLDTIDAPVTLATIYAQPGGVVTSLDVQSNYIDILLDSGSDISFNAAAGFYFNLPNPVPAGVTVTPGCIQDQIGLQSTVNATVRLEVTSTRPVCPGGGGGTYIIPKNYSFSINNDADCTETENVILNLQAEDAEDVLISNNEHFVNAQWQEFTNPSEINWRLESGDGLKTVYVLYRSSTNTFSNKLSDSIELKYSGCDQVADEPEEEPGGAGDGLDLEEGDLIKGSLSAVYYYSDDGKRHAFPDIGTYDSYYNGDFSMVQKITDQQLSTISLGANMTYNPGVRMLKIQSIPKVYFVTPGAVLRWVTSEKIAEELYGENWSDYVNDLNVAFWPDYTIGEPIYSVTDLPENFLPGNI